MTIFSDNPYDRRMERLMMTVPNFCTERRGLPFYRSTTIHHGNNCRYTHGDTDGHHAADTLSALPKKIQ